MGLFNRKPSADAAEVAALRSEVAEMRSRLDAAEAAKAEMSERLRRLGDDADAHAHAMTSGASGVKEQMAQLHSRLDSAGRQLVELEALRERVASAEAASARLAELDVLSTLPARVDELTTHVTRTSADAEAARTHAAALDGRLTQVATELANQLAELGREMDSLSSRPAPTPPQPTSETVVEQLREGQVRLANEQARYEIAFREDLAMLAEQVRLLRGR
jgi:chromosome segregation ATPase